VQHAPPPSCAPELLERLAATEAKWFEIMDLAKKYAAYPRSRSSELRVGPYLDTVFGTNPGRPASYTFECHANACRIFVNEAVASHDWMLTLQTHEDHIGLITMFSFGASPHIGLVASDEDLRAARKPVKGIACVTLEARLAEAEDGLEESLGMQGRFLRSERSTRHEQTLRPLLDAFFANRPGAPYKLECRSNVCRIDHEHGWIGDFQTGFGLRCANGIMVGASGPTTSMAICELSDPAVWFGDKFMEGVLAAVRKRVEQISKCKQLHPAPTGAIELQVTIGNPRSLVIEATGSLSKTPAATCFRRIVDDAIAEVTFPVYESIELPPRPIRFWVHAKK
jgi:hypothetical protein